jgi:hypothetical protein
MRDLGIHYCHCGRMVLFRCSWISSATPANFCLNPSKIQSQSYFTTDGLRPISSSWREALRDSGPTIFFNGTPCCHSPYVTSSLTRGWVCRLQPLLVLASGIILGTESGGTRDHILLSGLRDSPNLEGRVPRHRVSFSSPPTTRRATVEIFKPASTSRTPQSVEKFYNFPSTHELMSDGI